MKRLEALTTSLAHRGGWAFLVPRMRPSSTLLERIGGQIVVDQIVDALYYRIEKDEFLLPLFKHDLSVERDHQKQFFGRWMGGHNEYFAYRGLRARHQSLVTKEGAKRWLHHFGEALQHCKVQKGVAREIMEILVPMAHSLAGDKALLQCQSWYRKPAAEAGKGSMKKVKEWVASHPELVEPGPAQLLLHMAARRNRREIVDFLLDEGVDVNLPDCTQTGVAVTPYCIARSQRNDDLADYLLERGALIDVFTLAWLGDAAGLSKLLAEAPSLVNVEDPAQDFCEVYPLEHAVIRAKLPAVELLLSRGASLTDKGKRYLDIAVNKRRAKLVRLLLDHGVSAEGLGPGPWLIDDKLNSILFARGASVQGNKEEWLEYCTGHHGNPEQPELIKALIHGGVELNSRDKKGRTALHCSTRVGYRKVMKVLIEVGIEIDARDDNGNSALHYVFQARPSVDRVATAQVLLAAGAKPKDENNEGKSSLSLVKTTKGKDRDKLLEIMEKYC
mgnify:CR=1 FL=1